MNEIDIRPSLGSLLDNYRRLSYKPETAIAEFIDNSTASYFKNKMLLVAYRENYKLIVEIDYNEALGVLTIKDNAFGMDEETFRNALVIGKRPKETNGRNEFGMGLKTAASWLGSFWSVSSKVYGSDKKYYCDVDIEKIKNSNADKIEMFDNKADKKEYGTIVSIKNLYRKISKKNLENLREAITSIYRRDIARGEIIIKFNGSELTYCEPKILETRQNGNIKKWREKIYGEVLFDNKIYKYDGYIALKGDSEKGERKSGYKEMGFVLFRRGRVIVGGVEKNYKPRQIFGSPNSFISLRLFGEINLDDWPVSQAKDAFEWSLNGLEDEFISSLQNNSTIKNFINFANEYRVKNAEESAHITQVEAESFRNSLASDINCVKEMKIVESQKSVCSVETNNDISAYNISVKLNDKVYVVKVKFINDSGSELFKVEDIKDENLVIVINSAFPLLREMENNRKFLNMLQKYIVLMVLSEKLAMETSLNNGLIYPYAIRNILNQCLMQISEDGNYIENIEEEYIE